MRFYPILHEPPDRRHDEIIEGSDDENLQYLELYLNQDLRPPQELLHRDDRGQGGRLKQAVKRVSQRRNNDAHCLRQDDDAHRHGVGHADRPSGVELSFGHRQDAGSDDLSEISAFIEAEANQCGLDDVEADAELDRKSVV